MRGWIRAQRRRRALEFAVSIDDKGGMRLDDAFLAVSDANRRHLLEELRRGPKTVGELAAGLPISRPAVSQHLKVLLDAGLVTARPEGTRRVYAVDPQGFLGLNIWLDQFWDGD